jgi:hypothetical protein
VTVTSLRLSANVRASESFIAAIIVFGCSMGVALCGIVATAGGVDQQGFHLPAVRHLLATAPALDVVGLPTATGPLYHLMVAAVAGPAGVADAGIQIVGALFAAALAAMAVRHVRVLPDPAHRLLAVAPLLLSAYFWQSALWMLTDDAAVLFGLAAVLVALSGTTRRQQVGAGLLIAAAIGTRQNFVWLLAPVCAYYLIALADQPAAARGAALARVGAPGLATLALLIWLWGGLTPPAGREFNAAAHSPTALAYAAAVTAVFALPILLSVVDGWAPLRRHLPAAVTVGLLAAAPAVIFTSNATTAPDQSRRGGLVWSLVAAAPDVMDRSPMLVALAFLGGAVTTLLCLALPRSLAVLLSVSVLALATVTAAGAQLYQKYVELPLGMLALVIITQLFAAGRIRRNWPLAALAVLQAVITAAVVGLPILRAGA